MSIMTRVVRLWKADIHGVMDQLEDKGLLLKQYLRDMEAELGRKESQLKKLMRSKDQAKRDQDRYAREIDTLEQDIAVAVGKDKDDIARFLIKKLKPIKVHRQELDRHIEELDRQIQQLKACFDDQKRQYENLQLRASEYVNRTEREKWDRTLAGLYPTGISSDPSDEEIEVELLRRKEQQKGVAHD